MAAPNPKILVLDGLVIKTPSGAVIEIGADVHGRPAITFLGPNGERRTEIHAGLVRVTDEPDETSVDLCADAGVTGLTIMDASLTDASDDIRLRAQLSLNGQGEAGLLVLDSDGVAVVDRTAAAHDLLALLDMDTVELQSALETHQQALAAAERAYEVDEAPLAQVRFEARAHFERMWIRRVTDELRHRAASATLTGEAVRDHRQAGATADALTAPE